MNARVLAYLAIGAAGFLAFRWWQHRRFVASIGGDQAYANLAALQPRITAPVIRVAPPVLRL